MAALFVASVVATEAVTPEPSPVALSVEAAEVLVRGARGSIVRVSAESCHGPMTGSGFVVGDALVTNRHLVDGANYLVVAGDGGHVQSPAIEVAAVSAEHDLALVAGDWPGSLALAPANPPVGDEVVMVGWVDGIYRWLIGRVHLYTSGKAYDDEGTVMLIDPATTFGFSGGPVLDSRGRVVGVLRAFDQSTGLTVAVPVSELSSWLKSDANHQASTGCMTSNP